MDTLIAVVTVIREINKIDYAINNRELIIRSYEFALIHYQIDYKSIVEE